MYSRARVRRCGRALKVVTFYSARDGRDPPPGVKVSEQSHDRLPVVASSRRISMLMDNLFNFFLFFFSSFALTQPPGYKRYPQKFRTDDQCGQLRNVKATVNFHCKHTHTHIHVYGIITHYKHLFTCVREHFSRARYNRGPHGTQKKNEMACSHCGRRNEIDYSILYLPLLSLNSYYRAFAKNGRHRPQRTRRCCVVAADHSADVRDRTADRECKMCRRNQVRNS